MPGGSTGTRTNRRCTSTWSRRVLRAQSASAAHARQLRAAGRRQSRPERRLAGAAQSGHQSRLPGRHRSPRRLAGAVHVGLRAAGLSRRSACRRSCTATCSSPSRRPTSSAGSCSTTTATTLRARKAYERGEFLASTDERFRPVYLANAPDGTLYVVDMYRGIIEHRLSITMYLRDQILARKLDRPTGIGRIYRVVHDTTVRDTTRGPVNASAADLVALLSHPNGWRRDTAQRLLVERRRQVGRAGAGETGRPRKRVADAPARAVDARRARCDRARARHAGARRRLARDSPERGPPGGALARRDRTSRSPPRSGSGSTIRTPPSAGSWPRRWARPPVDPRRGPDGRARTARRRSDHDGRGAQRPARSRSDRSSEVDAGRR